LDEAVVAFETIRKMINERPSVTMYSILIHGFVKCGQLENALKVYDEMINGPAQQGPASSPNPLIRCFSEGVILLG
jgi:pentatricopeptide repeat protein